MTILGDLAGRLVAMQVLGRLAYSDSGEPTQACCERDVCRARTKSGPKCTFVDVRSDLLNIGCSIEGGT